MPCQGYPFPLDEGALCPFSVVLENLHDLPLPSHVGLLRQVLPVVRARLSDEASVLCAQAQFRDMAHPLIQKGLIPTTDNPNRISRVGCEALNGPQHAVRRNGRLWILDNGC